MSNFGFFPRYEDNDPENFIRMRILQKRARVPKNFNAFSTKRRILNI